MRHPMRLLVLISTFTLAVGLFVGSFLPQGLHLWRDSGGSAGAASASYSASSQSTFAAVEQPDTQVDAPVPIFNAKDSFRLLSAAYSVCTALSNQDFKTLSTLVHPQHGLTFTPYSTVNLQSDLTFTPQQLAALGSDRTVYTWGFTDGRGSLIQMTGKEYFAAYVYNLDYLQAPEIGVDHIMVMGNALDNIAEEYPGCRFVDLSFPSLDPELGGLIWSSLRLVFQPSDTAWTLVGIVHGQWTT